MEQLLSIPEIRALDGPASLIRIPDQIDVPVTERVMALIDAPEFQRLSKISQLGLVSCVYPAANHNRFEHSLGVYRNALLFLRQLANRPRFCQLVSVHDAQRLIVAALLHDIGHWPFCHPIEDMKLEGLFEHEDAASRYLHGDAIRECLKSHWGIEPDEVLSILAKDRSSVVNSILSSILSGPIDVDKMDYLHRDSLHAGVPYGQNFDAARLIRSLCLNEAGDKLAISQKGRTAAELMVISRYTMFCEVYWHHAVRSATCMLQRAFYQWFEQNRLSDNFQQQLIELFHLSESEMISRLRSDGTPALSQKLLDSLFGDVRRLHKRIRNYSVLDKPDLYQALAHRSYPWLVSCGDQLSQLLGQQLGESIPAGDVLVDAPPVGLEVQFDIEVAYDGDGDGKDTWRSLGEVSPLINTLASRQFDDHVKQVRIFADPAWADRIRSLDVDQLLRTAISEVA
jgi:HD superfamily phosphohydrolase